MGIFRSFFGRKTARPPEIWEPPAPRAEPGLPPMDVRGRAEPGRATPAGCRPSDHGDIDASEGDSAERWAPGPPAEHEFDEPLPDAAGELPPVALATEPEPAEPEPIALDPVALTPGPEVADIASAVVADTPNPAEPAPEPAQSEMISTPPPVANIRTILAEIETLGDSPELGLLRETLGAEPDGLFGFSTMYPPALITLLRNRFAGTGALENLATKPAWGHHYIVDQRYGFTWKSAINVTQMSDDAVLAYESARLTRLRDQLIHNLSGNKRLFVYAGPASPDHIASIRAAMRSYGVNTLLHLVIADGRDAPGQVAWQEEGLLRGTLSRYGSRDGKWDIAVDDWIAVCRAAHQHWKDSSGP